ncbi:dihydropteroate synthase [Allobranchiibius sp. CTAmp26]|uniref:dihydropteroate synthase n=1 Tax=Allobranchiibius sp. CTAmp26 TaxID=2815214 RepID=UPI0027DB75AF|nr:dihydropteroate synthase [Allobranchiibius sp. CTAmp26]
MTALPARPATRPLVMGVVNVTPDSFSDGGRWFAADEAVRHGRELHEQGADLVDVGGESTRPGARRPDEREELRRVVPVVRQLTADGVRVSIDTMRARVAARAVEAGAVIVNDVSGGLADPEMAATVAALRVGMVAMHWRGHSHQMADRAVYDDVVADVRRELGDRVDALLSAGIARDALVIDPGLGFAKTAEQNWTVLRDIAAFEQLGLPVLVGASRKGFLARVGSDAPLPPDRREGATTALTVLLAQAGVWGVRVHDVAAARAALAVVETMGAGE